MEINAPGIESDPRLDLVYSESVRAISLQASSLDEFRSRAGTIIQSASIAGGILGAVQIGKFHSFDWATWAGVSAFGLVGTLTTIVLWPRWSWKWSASPKLMLSAYMSPGKEKSSVAVVRAAALELEKFYDENDSKMSSISWLLAGSCVALVGEIVFFLIGLGQS